MAPTDSPILQAAMASPGWVEAANTIADTFAEELQQAQMSLQNHMQDLQVLLDQLNEELTGLTEDCDAAHTELQQRFAEVREELARTHAEIDAAEEKVKASTLELTQHLEELDKKVDSTLADFNTMHTESMASQTEMATKLLGAHGRLTEQTIELPIRITALMAAVAVATVQVDEAAPVYRKGVEALQEAGDDIVEKAVATETEAAADFEQQMADIDGEWFRPSITMAEQVDDVLDADVVVPFRAQAESYGAKYIQLATQLRAEIDAVSDASDEVTPMQEVAQELTDQVIEALPTAKDVFDKLGVNWPGR
ncbi:MAG: hypothetical protein ACR2IE_04975 [Candidatus Sumerlaeaceae bacterium]